MLMRRPIAACAVLWIIGIHLAVSYKGVMAWGMIACIMAMLGVLFYTKKLSLLLLLLYAVSVILSYGYFFWYDSNQSSAFQSTSLSASQDIDNTGESSFIGQAEGWIDSPVEVDGDRVQFELRTISWTDSKGEVAEFRGERLLVQVKLKQKKEVEQASQWARGQRVNVQGELELPGTSSNFGAFDYREYLRYKHMYWLLKGEGGQAVSFLSDSSAWSLTGFMGSIEAWREKVASIYDQLFPKDQSTYLQGLVLGMRSDLDVQIEHSFSELGLTHVLAISGLHVAVFVGSCLFVFRLLRLTRETSLVIVMILIPLYVVFTGASPSVVRAGMMSVLALIGLRQGWIKDGLHLLAGALLAMLFFEPYYAMNVSFQLSFTVTAGLIIGVPLLQKLWPVNWPGWLRSSLSVSITAQLVSFPLTIYYFNQISLLSLLANLVFVPFISGVVLPLGTLTLLVSIAWYKAALPLAWLLKQCNDLTFTLIHGLSRFEQATLIFATPPLWWIAAYYGLLLTILFSLHKLRTRSGRHSSSTEDTVPLEAFQRVSRSTSKVQRLGLSGAILAFTFILYIGYTNGPPAHTTLSVLDIGQGDSLLLHTSSGRAILIDGGGTISFERKGDEWKRRRKPYEVGASRIVPLLKQRGIRQLDAVVLTHGDADHAGGLQAVIEQIGADRLIMNGTWKSSSTLTRLYQAALDRGIPIIGWKANDQWEIDDTAKLTVMYPSKHELPLPVEKDQNDASLVLMLTMMKGKASGTVLLTGDIGMPQEREIVSLLESTDVDIPHFIDVLKVAHHGSKTSTSKQWMDHFKPRISVISVGKNNRYGHPSEVTLQTLKEAGSKVWRTDHHGEIQLSMDSQGLKLRAKHDRMTQ